jgi:EmrB/QacA subfamily drug resistance transporter
MDNVFNRGVLVYPTTIDRAAPAHENRAGGRPWMIVALLCAAQFMLILDITVVNVALPAIQADVGIALVDLQWVVTAYTLVFGGLVLLGGRAADLFGRRRVFLSGLAVFTAASLASALAGSAGVLIAARAGQGLGAAMVSPAALSLIATIFTPGPARHRALGAWAAVAASGGAIGVLAGGVLTQSLGWRAIFYLNLPVGLLVGLAALWLIPSIRPAGGRRLDVAGALLATGSLVVLIFGLVEAGSAGWASAQTLGLFTLAAAGIASFIVVESRTKQPLIALAILRRRPTVVALALFIVGMGTVFSGFYYCSLYLQQVLGHSALRTGLEFVPVAVAIVVAAHMGGHLISRWGAKPVITAGLGIAAAGTLLLSGLSAHGSYVTDILPGFLALGAGGGLAAAGVMVTALSGATQEDAGAISGLTSAAHELSIAVVLPVLSTVVAAGLGAAVHSEAPSTDPVLLASGFADAFRAAAAIVLAGVLLALVGLRRADAAAGSTVAHMIH